MCTIWQDAVSKHLGSDTTVLLCETLREWSQSRVIGLTVESRGQKRTLYAKQAHVGMEVEVAVYQLAAHNAEFPAPKGMLVNVGGVEWLLLDEATGACLAKSQPKAYAQAALRLAAFHELAAQREWAKKAGIKADFMGRLSTLITKLPAAISQLGQCGQFSSVDMDLLESVHLTLSNQKDLFTENLSVLPQTLVHGDCHSGNIFVHEGGVHLVDWGSAVIAPGLLDIVGLIDVAERMKERINNPKAIVSAYWSSLSAGTQREYGSLEQAWRLLRTVRSLLELEWFVKTDDDYGIRTNRELLIIKENLW